MRALIAAAISLLLLCFSVTTATAQEPVLATPEQQQEMMGWIPPSCCVTNNCCFEVPASELKPEPDDQWRIVATGQVLYRTEWSQTGKYIRCACDWIDDKGWTVSRGAHTRCVFPVMQSARRKR